jgi:hypothetical protein
MARRSSLSPPKHPLHEKLRVAGISHISAAYQIGVPFSTLSRYLCSYGQMPESVEQLLEMLIKEVEIEDGLSERDD